MEGVGSVSSSRRTQPFSPAVPNEPSQPFQGQKEEQPRDPPFSLQGSECTSVSEIRNGAEDTMKLPLPAASRQWRLYPTSGTVLFPARRHLRSSFQTGAEPCCFLLAEFSVSLLSLFGVLWPPTGWGSAGDPHPPGASVVPGTA